MSNLTNTTILTNITAPPLPYPLNLTLADLQKYDTLTYGLVSLLAVLLVATAWSKPEPLAHPLLFGRQADVSRSRKKGESAVYRNYGVGHNAPLVARPKREIKTIMDLVQESQTRIRGLWSTSIINNQLKGRISSFATGLITLAKLTPKESNVLLLLNDSIEFLIADLALSSLSITSFTVASLSLVVPVLSTHPASAIIVPLSHLEHILEQIVDAKESRLISVIVVPEDGVEKDVTALGKKAGVKVLMWDEVEDAGGIGEKVKEVETEPGQVFSVAFFSVVGDRPLGAELTHESVTAGATAVSNLFPSGKSLKDSDTVISSFPLATPYGRAVAYAAIYNGSTFATAPSTALFKSPIAADKVGVDELLLAVDMYSLPPPSVLFITPTQLTSVSQSILTAVGKFFMLAWRHKMAAASRGYLADDTVWDRWIFDAARKKAAGKLTSDLRQVVVAGEPISHVKLRPSRLLLSVPITVAHISPLVCGPVSASHPWDLQFFRTEEAAHVGPPTSGIEIKVVGVDDDLVEAGGDPVGEMHVRGPAVLGSVPAGQREDGWVRVGDMVGVQSNGTVVVLAGHVW